MESSLYNVFVPTKKGYAVYNTLTESILFCDEELKNALEHNALDNISPAYTSVLQNYGVIVKDTHSELRKYQVKYNSRLFDTGKIQAVLVTTYACNLACPYCYEGRGDAYSSVMDYEMANRVLKALQNQILQQQSTQVTVILFGGEPLLNLKVGEHFVESMKRWCTSNGRKMRTFMVTNGTLLTQEKASHLKGLIDGVQLTFDGSQPYHDTTRIYKNGKGTYSDVVSAVECALSNGMKVSLRVQISRENCDHIEDLFTDIRPFLKTGKTSLNIAPLSRYSSMCSNYSSHFLKKEEKETVLPTMLQYTQNINPVPHFLPCVAFSNNLIFDGTGNVYKCITSVGEDVRVGQVGEKGIVWEPELYAFMGRNPLKISECKTCPYLPLCGGGCPRTARLTCGTYESSVCGGSKTVYYESLSLYLRRKFPEKFQEEASK